jgi:hypothetical protein
MIAKFFSLAALATAVVAQQACSTGPVQCCNSVQTVQSPQVHQTIADNGISLAQVLAEIGDVNALIGLTCNPINVIGISGNSW